MVRFRLGDGVDIRALFLAIVIIGSAATPAQAQEASPSSGALPEVPDRTLVDVPVPSEPRLPGTPDSTGIIAERWFAASGDAERRDVILDVLAAIGLGVYSGDGTPILLGAERSIDDPWLYDFEVALIAEDSSVANPVTVEDIAASIEDVIEDAAGAPFEASALAEAVRSAVAEAVAEPSDPVGFPLRLARELQLRASGADLAETLPEDEPLTSLAALLIELDIILPFAEEAGSATALGGPDYRPIAGRVGKASRTRADVRASAPKTAQLCAQFAGAANRATWDIGKVAGKLGAAGARVVGGTSFVRLFHRRLLLSAITIRGFADKHEIHHRHPGDSAEGSNAAFTVHVRVVVDLSRTLRACGVLSGLPLPGRGPLAGVPVDWQFRGAFMDHGAITCPQVGCRETDQDGNARLVFTPLMEPEMPILGPEKHTHPLVYAKVRPLVPHGGEFPFLQTQFTWPFDVDIGWHEPYRYEASGGGSGLSVSGTIDDLAAPFTLEGKFKGATVTMEFQPKSAYRGKVTDHFAGSGVTGGDKGTYTIKVNENDTLTLNATTKGRPNRVGKSKSNKPVITLTPIE